jgi:hypothetical protein
MAAALGLLTAVLAGAEVGGADEALGGADEPEPLLQAARPAHSAHARSAFRKCGGVSISISPMCVLAEDFRGD